ncbi:hypothetical protein OGAPHI_004799 [Ogataea philodendri]|uniref:Uncharacterized protein n=1 Tax=Ogataea philodendri TaxID=1378263 RepID=A0A9P8T3K2_9ASCO|nr:uncharacterized protein OGAPHI_004799 [Ogataea philodendri]KAH3664085.1 hypothetical protein OGAPHI_004799 [Ogataea philodendri]
MILTSLFSKVWACLSEGALESTIFTSARAFLYSKIALNATARRLTGFFLNVSRLDRSCTDGSNSSAIITYSLPPSMRLNFQSTTDSLGMYLIEPLLSNSPSGGMKETILSASNLDNRTHWWNFTSSTSIPLDPLAFPEPLASPVSPRIDASPPFKNRSFSPKTSSGIPERYDFNLMAPWISELSIWPLALISISMHSTTSKYASFFL